ncbi:MAG TPA: hypothetical protein VFM09_06055 [Marmoricola sp.]|nr:hypothetical protein [Marmoricola sp.]
MEPLYGCCPACATDSRCQRCVSCGTWHHDHARTRGVVALGPDDLPRCAPVCGGSTPELVRRRTLLANGPWEPS